MNEEPGGARPKVYLIDGTGHIYRAFYAIKDLKTSKGVPTNAVYGFTAMLTALIRDREPDYLAVVLDAKGPTFRHELYEPYKANRPPMPEPLRPQIPLIREIVEAFGVVSMEKEGFEADDIIGTLANTLAPQGYDVVIVSNDKDMLQLVNADVTVLDTKGDRTIDSAGVEKQYGVGPGLLRDLFGLMGDTSDNIPGAPGIGPKRACELIQRFGSLEEAVSRAEEVKQKKIREALVEYRDQIYLSKRLVTIDDQVPLNFSMKDLRPKDPDKERLRALFKELEFHRFLNEWTDAPDQPERNDIVVDTPEALESLVRALEEAGRFAIHLETTDGVPMKAEILGIALAASEEETYYISLEGQVSSDSDPERDRVLSALRPVLESPSIKKIGHDLKAAAVTLVRYGISLEGMDGDTMVASYVLNPSRRNHKLDEIALEYGDRKIAPAKTAKKKKQADWTEKKAGEQACEAAHTTFGLHQKLASQIEEGGFETLYRDLEIPLIPVLARMEFAGVKVDTELLQQISHELGEKIAVLEETIYDLAEGQFNINSPQQLGTILFEKLKLPVIRKTKTGYSTDMEVLKELSKTHDLPASVLEYRSLAKLKSTYLDALPKLAHPDTGRIHTAFNQAVTATGRLSSSEPNLQNIPIRTEIGKRIRSAFIPEDGCVLLSADYSQVELRIMAHLAEDPILIEAFRNGEDIHTRTACEVFGIPVEMMVPEMRRQAKAINFGIIYGLSAFGLARDLNVDMKIAKAFIDGYFQRYKGVKTFIDRTLDEARKNGYVETIMGRRRYLPEINSKNNTARKFAERTAVNTPVQGSAADMIKKAMIRIEEAMDAQGLKSRMILQVHDELLFEVPEDERERVEAVVIEEMEGVQALKVPLKVDAGTGKTWADAH